LKETREDRTKMEVESEDKVTINHLPEEVLLTILEYLKKDDLKNAALVAPSWNKIISSNSSTMKHLPLLLCNPSEDEMLEITKSTRKFIELFVASSKYMDKV
jgi:F-box-like